MTSVDETRAAYDAVAPAYAVALPDVAEPAFDLMLLEHFARQAQGPVLDAGCGTGRVAVHLARRGLDVEGVDLSAGMVEQARARYPGIRFRTADLADLGGQDAAYGAVLSWYSIVHTPPGGLAAIWAELRRVLRPGGMLLVAFKIGNGRHRVSRPYGVDVAFDVYRVPVVRVCEGLAAAGFEVEARIERAPVDPEQQPQGFVIAR